MPRCGVRLSTVLLISSLLVLLVADPALAKKGKSGGSSRSASCCSNMGQYQPRLDRVHNKTQRYWLATNFRRGN